MSICNLFGCGDINSVCNRYVEFKRLIVWATLQDEIVEFFLFFILMSETKCSKSTKTTTIKKK